ncbi:translation initiation factor IF-3, mitochondrial [Toxorhynchites rutilus septentrionalis]|uniref:translation initiation factor IF-3, mitochondrial n=1 Tax=Toxorhynchites rutilus septentrionalis TaxID=329112 RepID=UPI00247A5FFC|nr:translation initiation factor IF-3, mitochondrial [Toxorhynchites rutilus septentrionalis]
MMRNMGRVLQTTLYCQPFILSTARPVTVSIVSQQQYSSKYSKSPSASSEKVGVKNDAVAKKTKTAEPKITLIGTDQSVSIVGLTEAQNISKRRDLKLVRIVDLDVNSQRPIYKLMTSAEYLTEELKRREDKKRNKDAAAIKGEKLLAISARITEHDLTSKIQNVLKWLKKSYEVRVVISGEGNKSQQESIANRFESETKDAGKIVQKRIRDNNLRFQIVPSASIPDSNQVAPGTEKKGLLDEKQVANDTQSVRAYHTERR